MRFQVVGRTDVTVELDPQPVGYAVTNLTGRILGVTRDASPDTLRSAAWLAAKNFGGLIALDANGQTIPDTDGRLYALVKEARA